MQNDHNIFLIAGAALSGIAALLHLACIYFGAPLFRFLGTEAMARMYETGNFSRPIVACLILTVALLICSAYALSGAGVIPKLPLLRVVLVAITLVYLARGLAFPFLKQYFPENSALFWYTSSLTVFILGVVHLVGIGQVWKTL